MVPACYPSKISSTTGLREAVVFALPSVTGLVRWTDYIPVKLVASADAALEGRTDAGGFIPMDMLSSNTGLMGWVDYLPVYVDNSATDAWAITAAGFIPYAPSGGVAISAPAFTVTLDNLVGLTGGGTTNVFMTGSSGGGGVVVAASSASRLTGVAPLYVNFDATATTSTLSTNPSHELFFAHDFGDTGAGTWANGVQSSGLTSKNAGYGPVTGHVYETPGTYTYTMAVTDGVNTATRTKTIVVQDPNVVYAGALTICISHSGNFTGKPTGALEVNTAGNTDMYAAWNGIVDKNNKRILFCKADSWTCSQQLPINNIAGVTISGYGTGASRAAVFGAAGTDTLVNVTPSDLGGGSVFNITSGVTDLRVCNFKITANSGAKASAINNSISQVLFYKVEVRSCPAGFSAPTGGGGINNVMDQHCIYECLVDDVYGYAGAAGNTPRASSTTNGTSTLSATAHPFAVGYGVQFPTTAPSPLAINATYYISADSLATDSFRLAATLADAKAGANSLGSLTAGTHLLTVNGIGGGMGVYAGFVRGGMMGCYVDNCNHGENAVRLPYLDRAHINNNYIARPNQGKNIVKIHGFVYVEMPLYTEKFVFSGNVLSMRNGYSYGDTVAGATMTEVGTTEITVGNGGALGDERVRNCIIENNITYGCLGNAKSSLGFVSVGCPNVTVRNNIADFSMGDRTSSYDSGYANTHMSIGSVGSSTNDPTVGVRFYNNTLYSNFYNAENASFVNFSGLATAPTASGAIGTPGVWTSTNHKLYVGFRVQLIGTPPAPLATGTFYWVTATNYTANTFTLSATEGGAPLALSGTGTCTVSQFVQVDDVKIKNNIWYLPHHNPANPYRTAYRFGGSPPAAPTNIDVSNNTDNNGGSAVSPGFVATPPVALTDWKPSGYPVGAGVSVPVLRDFNNAARVGAGNHLGAVLP